MSLKLYPIARLVLAWALAVALTATAAPKDLETRFMEAHDAFQAGERVRLARLAEGLRGSEYAPWVEHWQLRLRLEEDSSEGVPQFLEREAGSYLAERLRGEWLRQLGKREDWQTFQREYPPLVQPDQEVACYALQARLARQHDDSALDEARPLWFSVVDMPDGCQPLMDKLLAAGRLSADDIWARMRRLVEARRIAAAKTLARSLPAAQALDGRRLDALADNPERFLLHLPGVFANTRGGRETALLAVARLSRGDPAAAARVWRPIESKFGDADRAYAWGQMATQGAMKHLPEALDWYALADPEALSDEQAAWRVRAALRAGKWPAVEDAIDDMPPKLAAQPEWVYWLGRALAAQGRHEEAKALYLKIGGRPSFYGVLANEEMGRPIAIPPRAAPPTAEEIAAIAANPGLKRALAVMRTDVRSEGVREWSWYLRGMDDRQLLAAAEYARRQDVFDRAVITAERTVAQHDYALRYLAPFRDQVTARTREAALDDAWVYGLMRQESRFAVEARSSAGARGLMQLMPTTARWVAKKIGLVSYHPSRVTETETNVILGVNYLKMISSALDNHPVLASAAYNAGPNRAQRWRADRPLEGAIYAETIPLGETRDYVKKVMCNAAYYAVLFDYKPQTLKARLGTIRPRGVGDEGIADLP